MIAVLAGLSAACLGAFVVLFRWDGPALADVLQAYSAGGAAASGGGAGAAGIG